NAALRCNGMRAPRRILKTKTFHPVSEFTEGRRNRSAGEAAADDYDLKFSPVVRADQSRMVSMISPFLIERPGRNFRIQCSNHASDMCLEYRNGGTHAAIYCSPPHLSFLNDTRPDPSSKASKRSGFSR